MPHEHGDRRAAQVRLPTFRLPCVGEVLDWLGTYVLALKGRRNGKARFFGVASSTLRVRAGLRLSRGLRAAKSILHGCLERWQAGLRSVPDGGSARCPGSRYQSAAASLRPALTRIKGVWHMVVRFDSRPMGRRDVGGCHERNPCATRRGGCIAALQVSNDETT